MSEETVLVLKSDLEALERSRIELCEMIDKNAFQTWMYAYTEPMWVLTHRKLKGGLHEPE